MDPKDCPTCDAHHSLEKCGAKDSNNCQWFFCTVCAKKVLIAMDTGTLLRIGEK